MQIDVQKVLIWVAITFGAALIALGRYIWVLKDKQDESTAEELKKMNSLLLHIPEMLKKLETIENEVKYHGRQIENLRVWQAQINQKLKIENTED